MQHVASTFRASVPQFQVEVDRIKAETMQVPVGDVFNVLVGYIGSSYVNQFNTFGRTFQVYVQAECEAVSAATAGPVRGLYVRSAGGQMVPLGALVIGAPGDRAGGDLVSTTFTRVRR